MEDSLEIIIYVVIAVASLIGNAYRNYSKRKQQEANPSPAYDDQQEDSEMYETPEYHRPQNNMGLPGSIIEEIKQYYEPEEFFEMPDVQAIGPDEEKLHEEETETSDSATSEDEIKKEEILSLDDEETEEEPYFDLEKAVIYSEILKPKYIDTHY